MDSRSPIVSSRLVCRLGTVGNTWRERLSVKLDAIRSADEPPDSRRAVLGYHHANNDFIPGFERGLGPALPSHVRRIAGFHNPMLHFTLFVLSVQLQKAMRIGPEPFRHSSSYSDFGSGRVGRVSVVCEQR